MTSPNITDVDITRGKTELKASILYAADNSVGQLDNISQQVLFKGRIISTAALVAEVDKISAADVKKVSHIFIIFKHSIFYFFNVEIDSFSNLDIEFFMVSTGCSKT